MIINTYKNLNENINSVISSYLEMLTDSGPCKVEEVKDNYVKVTRLFNNKKIGIVDKVPIIRPNSFSYPIQKGDIGLLISSNYSVKPFIQNSNLLPQNLTPSIKGDGYMFLPLAAADKMFLENNENIELYSLDGKSVILISNDEIRIKNKNTVIMNEDGVQVEDSNGNKINLSSNGVVIEDKNGVKITTSSSGFTIEDSNGNKVESSGISIKINNNLEVMQ